MSDEKTTVPRVKKHTLGADDVFSEKIEKLNHESMLMWGVLGIALLLAFPVTNTHFRPDSITYLRDAIRLATSFQYENTYRGPGFPLVGAIAYIFGGADSLATLALPRIAYCIAIVCFVGFANQLYGPWPALIAGLYVAASPLFFVVGSTYQLDIFLIAWLLLATWLNYLAYHRISKRLAIASGVALAFAFLTKEVAILLLPVWAMGWIAFYPTAKKRVSVAAWSLGAFGSVLAPWILYVSSDAATSRVLGKNVATSGKFSAFIHKITDAPLGFLVGIPGDIGHFWGLYFIETASGDIRSMGLYALVAIVSVILLIVLAIYRRTSRDIYLALAVCSFVPLSLYLADNTSQLRQAAVIFVFHALAIPRVIVFLGEWIARGTKSADSMSVCRHGGRGWPLSASCVVSVIIIIGCAVYSPTVRALFDTDFHGFGVTNWDTKWFSPTGKYNTQLLQAGMWIRDKRHHGKVMTAYRRNAKFLETVFDRDKLAGSAVAKHNVKHWRVALQEGGKKSALDAVRMKEGQWMNTPGKLLFVRVNRPGQWEGCVKAKSLDRVPDHYCKLYYWNERAVLQKIKDEEIKYVIVGDQMAFQRAYYDRSPAFERVQEFVGISAPNERGIEGIERSAVVYSVIGTEASGSFQIIASSDFTRMVRMYRTKKPKVYTIWREQVLRHGFGMTRDDISRAEEGALRCFEFVNGQSQMTTCKK